MAESNDSEGGDAEISARGFEAQRQPKRARMGERKDVVTGKLCEAFFETETGTGEHCAEVDAIAATLTVLPANHAAVARLRRILSQKKDDFRIIDAVVASGVLPQIAALATPANPRAKTAFEAAWVLTNVFGGNTAHAHAAADAGAVPALCSLVSAGAAHIKEEDEKGFTPLRLAEQAVWALGNAAGDCAELRDRVLAENGVVQAIFAIAEHREKYLPQLRMACWMLANLCRGKPVPPIQRVLPVLPLFCRIACSCKDAEAVSDCLWGLSYAMDSVEEVPIETVREIVSVAVGALDSSSSAEHVTAAVRIIGNIATGNDSVTQLVVDSGAVAKLCSLLDHPKSSIVKETCWVLSNITAGIPAQIRAVVEQEGLVSKLVGIATNAHLDEVVRKEAAWVVANAANMGNSQIARKLIELGYVAQFSGMLSGIKDVRAISVALEGLETLFRRFEGDELAALKAQFKECGGLDGLDLLQTHSNGDINIRAARIIESFFPIEDDDDEETQDA